MSLRIEQDDDPDDEFEPRPAFTDEHWEQLENVLNDRTGIMETYHSNHSLMSVSDGGDVPTKTKELLTMNGIENNFLVARAKIVLNQFSGPDMDTKLLLRMAPNAMPHVVSWIGGCNKYSYSLKALKKGAVSINQASIDSDCGARFNLMYELVRNLPSFLERGGDGTSVEVQPPASKKQKTGDCFSLKIHPPESNKQKTGNWSIVGEETRISWVLDI